MALLTTIRRMNGVAVAYCGGRLVLGEESKSLRLLVKDLLNKSPQIVLDLGDVTHMDSGGLGALVALYTSARAAGGAIKLVNLSARLRDRLQTSRLATVLEILGRAGDPAAALEWEQTGRRAPVEPPVSCSRIADALV